MTAITINTHSSSTARHMKLTTLNRLRWLAIGGQGVTIAVVYFGLGFELPLLACLGAIAASTLLNVGLTMGCRPGLRLAPHWAALLLGYDIIQLATLVFLTGGLQNPFALFILVPVIISATTHPMKWPMLLGGLAIILVSALAYFHLPLPWRPTGAFVVPDLYRLATWVGLVCSLLFMGLYVWRVARESRTLAGALAATELALAREQHLSALDGLAAAAAHELGTPLATIAVVSRELQHTLGTSSEHGEDIALLRSQSERCRDILERLNSLDRDEGGFFERVAFSDMLAQAARSFKSARPPIHIEYRHAPGDKLIIDRNPGLLHSIGNVLENAVNFARSEVSVIARWDADRIEIMVGDDGSGFSSDVLRRFGEPYLSQRGTGGEPAGGLGLGLFIAKSLIERNGGRLDIANAPPPQTGARVTLSWPR